MSEELPQDAAESAAKAKSSHPAWLPFAIDFGPLLAFFITFKLARSDASFGDTAGAVYGTAAFMVAILVAVAVSQWKLKKVSPMLWLSAILVIGFGGLTIWLNDERFIIMKPTIVYVLVAALLLGGWLLKKPMIKFVMQSAFDGLDDIGWLKLTRNWGFFFLSLAVMNHIMYLIWENDHSFFETWATFKVFGVTILSVLFAMSQVPVMLRHGLNLGDDK